MKFMAPANLVFPCFSNVVIKDMTILAPLNAPNTDGIDPGMILLSLFLLHLHFM